MKFFAGLTTLAALPTLISAVNVKYDTAYDNRSGSLATVACSDGTNGLLTRGFSTFGSLPGFPNIGGVPAVTGWDDADCGSCWKLTYTNGQGVSKSINIIAVDVASPNFNIALSAMNTLTNGQAQAIGSAPITAVKVAASQCGL